MNYLFIAGWHTNDLSGIWIHKHGNTWIFFVGGANKKKQQQNNKQFTRNAI